MEIDRFAVYRFSEFWTCKTLADSGSSFQKGFESSTTAQVR